MHVRDYTAEIHAMTALVTACGSLLSSLYAVWKTLRNRHRLIRLEENVAEHQRTCRDNGQEKELIP